MPPSMSLLPMFLVLVMLCGRGAMPMLHLHLFPAGRVFPLAAMHRMFRTVRVIVSSHCVYPHSPQNDLVRESGSLSSCPH